MNTTPKTIREKLNPRRFSNLSGKMIAILGWLLGEEFTNPSITEICVTSDGMVLAAAKGDCGANDFIGDIGDFRRNLSGVCDAAELTADETAWVNERIKLLMSGVVA